MSSSTGFTSSSSTVLSIVTSTIVFELIGTEIETLLLHDCSENVLKVSDLAAYADGINYGYETGSIRRNETRTFYNFVSFTLASKVRGIMNVKIFRTGKIQVTGCKGHQDVEHIKQNIETLFTAIENEERSATLTAHHLLRDHYVDSNGYIYYNRRVIGKSLSNETLMYKGTKCVLRPDGRLVEPRRRYYITDNVLFTLPIWDNNVPQGTFTTKLNTNPASHRPLQWTYRIVSLNTGYHLKKFINKDSLVVKLRNNYPDLLVSYDPSNYKNVNIKFFDSSNCPIGTILVAATGYLNMCGFRSIQSAEEQCQRLLQILAE